MDRRSTGVESCVQRYREAVTIRTHLSASVVFVGLCLLVGCSSFPSPAEQMARSQAAIRAAEEADADKLDPKAQLYLKLAREQLAKGKDLMDADENERADRLLRRAEADAELARGIAHVQKAKAGQEAATEDLSKIKPVN